MLQKASLLCLRVVEVIAKKEAGRLGSHGIAMLDVLKVRKAFWKSKK